MKKHLEVANKHTKNERRLFHGTSAGAVDLINKQGFNRSYAGTHGTWNTQGSEVRGHTHRDTQGSEVIHTGTLDILGIYIYIHNFINIQLYSYIYTHTQSDLTDLDTKYLHIYKYTNIYINIYKHIQICIYK